MAKDIGGEREPGIEGCDVGQIQSPMSSVNVQRKNTPTILTYGSTMDKNSPGGEGPGGGSKIMGPGQKNKL